MLPHCRKYPAQAAAIFQSYLDLTLGEPLPSRRIAHAIAERISSIAQGWSELEAIDLEECACVVLRGIPKKKVGRSHCSIVGDADLTSP